MTAPASSPTRLIQGRETAAARMGTAYTLGERSSWTNVPYSAADLRSIVSSDGDERSGVVAKENGAVLRLRGVHARGAAVRRGDRDSVHRQLAGRRDADRGEAFRNGGRRGA